jgi:hypothetical protein
MAEAVSINGIWKGRFIYGPEYGALNGISVEFTLTARQTGDSFSGNITDTSGIGANPEEIAEVKSVISNHEISFIKTYQRYCEIDGNGRTWYPPDAGPYDVTYNGVYDETTGKFSGAWEIISLVEVQINGGLKHHYCTGGWEMAKEAD